MVATLGAVADSFSFVDQIGVANIAVEDPAISEPGLVQFVIPGLDPGTHDDMPLGLSDEALKPRRSPVARVIMGCGDKPGNDEKRAVMEERRRRCEGAVIDTGRAPR